MDDAQRRTLLTAKLRALVVAHLGRPSQASDIESVDIPLAVGAALDDGEALWVLVDGDASRSVGPVLALTERRRRSRVHLVAEDGAGVAARRAAGLGAAIDVWSVAQRALVPAAPDPLPTVAAPSEEALAASRPLLAAGADVVIEHGVVLGEVDGLEMARVVDDEHGLRLAVGVGRHDRQATDLVHGTEVDERRLAEVVADLRRRRRPGSDHPLARLAAARRLRSWLVAEPWRVGLVSIEPVEGTLARSSVLDEAPAFALGRDAEGDVVLGCSWGIDLDLVPAAVDARARHCPSGRLMVVVPRRDDHPHTRRLAALASPPAEVRPVEVDEVGPAAPGDSGQPSEDEHDRRAPDGRTLPS
ncbi:MAG: hypothetical protein JJU45_16815 [Acidimicrobiia bacterium]|nr:hypothetical protein [Acidimicrobiia bacterium]